MRIGTALAQSDTTPASIEVVPMPNRFRVQRPLFSRSPISRLIVLHPRFWAATALIGMVVVTASCGGDDEPTAPSGSGVSTATLTIAVGGVISPKAVTINRGDRVTFVNNDTEPHTMS